MPPIIIYTVDRSCRVIRADCIEISDKANLHLPKTRNFKGIDAWISKKAVFQITISANAGLKEGVQEIIFQVGTAAPFIWVVPPEIFSDFKWQTTNEKFPEWVIEMPIFSL